MAKAKKAVSESKASRKGNDASAADEIDSIFVRAASEKPTPAKDCKMDGEAKGTAVVDDGFFDTRGRRAPKRKYTAEGFPIYTAEEMGLSRRDRDGKDVFRPSGASELCPFDCQCCF